MTVIGNSLYIVGGTTGWEYNCDVHKLNFSTAEWEEVISRNRPPPGR